MVANHLTEAACLIEQGAQYPCRIGLRPTEPYTDPIFAGFRAGAFSLFFGDSPFYHFDLDGRWQRAVVDGTHYLKGLDGRVQVVRRVREGRNLVLKRHLLSDGDASELDQRIRSVVVDLIDSLGAGKIERIEPPASKATPLSAHELDKFLHRIARWDGDAWALDRKRYLAAYGPLGLALLPPECQNAVVLQATLGRAGGVSFGGLAAGGSYVRSLAEFYEHTTLVAQVWGRRVDQSRFVFLGGSDVLRLPVEQVAAYLDVAGRTFSLGRVHESNPGEQSSGEQKGRDLAGVHALLDDFLQPRPDSEGWSELKQHGLLRVSLGIESGDPGIRTLYGKTYADLDVVATVRDIKSAGIGISVLTLVGARGAEGATAHVSETARLFQSLELGPGDFVFLLDETELGDSCRDTAGTKFFDRSEWAVEQARLKAALAPLKKRGVKVLPYTFDKQPL